MILLKQKILFLINGSNPQYRYYWEEIFLHSNCYLHILVGRVFSNVIHMHVCPPYIDVNWRQTSFPDYRLIVDQF